MRAATAPAQAWESVRAEPTRRVRGDIRVPGDKSISHRAALFGAVATGRSEICNFSPGADCASTLGCLEALGVPIEHHPDSPGRVTVQGVGPRGIREPAEVLDCGNSGTTMRLLAGLLAGQGLFAVLTGDASLRRRPMARVVGPLRTMGASIQGRDGDRLPPLAIGPAPTLAGLRHELPVASAQVKSAILLAGLNADAATTVVEPARTRDHTERMLRAMGAPIHVEGLAVRIEPGASLSAVDVAVPGDFSSAAFWVTLGCVHPDAEIRVRQVGLNPTRTGLLTVLERMGADVSLENVRTEAGEPVGDIVARSSLDRLRGIEVSGDLVPLAIDELPLVALLGVFARGETVVRDAGELRVKESDRLAAVAEGLQAMGGDVEVTEDGWRVRHSGLSRAALVESRGDHRMAMLFALAGVAGEEAVEISGAEAVAVSYPGFWSTLREVSGA